MEILRDGSTSVLNRAVDPCLDLRWPHSSKSDPSCWKMDPILEAVLDWSVHWVLHTRACTEQAGCMNAPLGCVSLWAEINCTLQGQVSERQLRVLDFHQRRCKSVFQSKTSISLHTRLCCSSGIFFCGRVCHCAGSPALHLPDLDVKADVSRLCDYKTTWGPNRQQGFAADSLLVLKLWDFYWNNILGF